jgi:hypothetical protein
VWKRMRGARLGRGGVKLIAAAIVKGAVGRDKD